MSNAFYVTLALLGILGFAIVILQFHFLKALRGQHPEAWRRLGSPTLLRNTISTSVNVTKYLLTGNYKELGSERISTLGRCIAIVGLIYSAAFLVALTLLLTGLSG
jgi:hypothetical protein